MQSDTAQTVLLIAADLGSVENYDPTVPLGRITTKGSLDAGGLYLRATLNEMLQILRLCEGLEENHRELLRETKAQYDNLSRRKKELESLDKSQSIFKPLKLIAIKRAKRAFLDNAQELWNSTRTTSERLKRALLSAPSVNLVPVESESVTDGERLSGLAVSLPPPPPGEMNPPGMEEVLAAAQKMASILASSGNPFADPTPSNSLDGQTSTARAVLDPEVSSSARNSVTTTPSSPGSASNFSWFNVNLNIVNNADSNAHGLTINNNGVENSGSDVTDHRSSVNSPPS
ncbi:hypothetical protein J3R82DRAFT_10998 [Butyriboletus roseoflavus]|nr:hypothetical protein J3R82DRAFT_10998 [Butyriboletus roseoflavus]